MRSILGRKRASNTTAWPRKAHALFAIAVLITSCTSAGSNSTRPSPATSTPPGHARYLRLVPSLVGCLARHGVIPAKDLRNQSFYRRGHVTVNLDFAAWWRDFAGLPVKVDGTWQHLDDVIRSAAENGRWPTRLCGRMPA